MNIYLLLVLLVSLSAFFAFINYKYLKMPFVIGLFFLSSILSLIILGGEALNLEYYAEVQDYLSHAPLSKIILEVMLGFLLFAGSLHTNWTDISKQWRAVSLFAVGGVLCSTLIVGVLLYYVCALFSYPIGLIHCLIFGALISPTDPIAVIGILTKANISTKVESTIVGESLFNDGVGIVLFIALIETLDLGLDHINVFHFGALFLQEAVGGIVFGLILGYILYRLLRSIDDYPTVVLLTIAFVMLGYLTCSFINVSGALAMVVMGLMAGNYKQTESMSTKTREHVNKFWEMADVLLNAVLFISIAFVSVAIDFSSLHLLIGLITVLIVLLSRIIIVFMPLVTWPSLLNINKQEAKILVWGGLRGGLSIALVLSLPKSEARQLLLMATYTCVMVSILVQGLTIERLAKYWTRQQ